MGSSESSPELKKIKEDFGTLLITLEKAAKVEYKIHLSGAKLLEETANLISKITFALEIEIYNLIMSGKIYQDDIKTEVHNTVQINIKLRGHFEQIYRGRLQNTPENPQYFLELETRMRDFLELVKMAFPNDSKQDQSSTGLSDSTPQNQFQERWQMEWQ